MLPSILIEAAASQDSFGCKKCFLTKLKTRLESIHDVKINTTILSDLIPNVFSLVESKTTGIFNFVNPGLISISDLIKKFDNKIEFKVVEKNYDNPELDTTKFGMLQIN